MMRTSAPAVAQDHSSRSQATLAGLALENIHTVLSAKGSSLTGEGLQAISRLLETFEAGLNGELAAAYHIAAIDPGMGKTLSVSSFIRAWKDQRFSPSSSILVALGRIDQIAPLIQGSGLTEGDVGVLVSKAKADAFGAFSQHPKRAPVLITTHSMLRIRTRDGSFADAACFHHDGKPRPLRIWDETLIPATSLPVRLDDLAGLASTHRQRRPELIAAVEAMMDTLRNTEDGGIFKVPAELAAWARTSDSDPRITALRNIAGQDAHLIDGGNKGRVLIGVGATLPDDLMPLVVLDASARVRPTYRLWEEHKGNVVRLPAAVNDYRNLTINLWQRGSGKVTLSQPAVRSEIVNAVAEEINKDDTSKWLIVHFKERTDIANDLRIVVTAGAGKRLAFLTWGAHDASNLYADYTNVVIIGQLHFGDVGFQALAMASAGSPLLDASQDDLDDFEWGEYQHNLLQALARASVRKSLNGVAGTCRAYVISTPSKYTEARVADTFPGCRLMAWNPVVKPMNGHVAAAAEYLMSRFSDPAVTEVVKGVVSRSIGISKANFSRILKHEQFVEFLAEEQITTTRSTFVLRRSSFIDRSQEPCPPEVPASIPALATS